MMVFRIFRVVDVGESMYLARVMWSDSQYDDADVHKV
jgi:hypothetical protein